MNETLFEIFKWTKSSYIICAESAEYALKSAALVCFVKQFILSIKRLKFLNQWLDRAKESLLYLRFSLLFF